ncbi:MAG: hypothetical protein HKN74_14125 [Acidimicrobiia bacterium]|nr:lysophospholipid acyltransferase family protein [Acidimicrobiia bacterium]NNF11411.1 hypothetical protein [Acidimicrobiia bacterium]NNL71555.1 hypothetical protein [Acidimicrobiia bacterium]
MSRTQTLQRRARSISVVTIGAVVTTAFLPLLLVLATGFDIARFMTGHRRFVGARLLVIGWLYLVTELIGLLALGLTWVLTGFGLLRGPLTASAFAIQRWWTGTLLRVIATVFQLKLEVEGDEDLAPGPIVVLMRHASIIDNLLPGALISRPTGIRLRYVLKKELLSDPALDVAGNRLPNYFVDRAAGGTTEVDAVGALGSGLGPDEGVLIYPEGTRFTPERRERALERLADRNPELLERGRRLQHVLPPRPGGPLALLDVTPPLDVIIAAHRGLDGFSHIRDIMEGGLVGSTVRVRFERHPHSTIPADRDARVQWLYDRWDDIDSWIARS